MSLMVAVEKYTYVCLISAVRYVNDQTWGPFGSIRPPNDSVFSVITISDYYTPSTWKVYMQIQYYMYLFSRLLLQVNTMWFYSVVKSLTVGVQLPNHEDF